MFCWEWFDNMLKSSLYLPPPLCNIYILFILPLKAPSVHSLLNSSPNSSLPLSYCTSFLTVPSFSSYVPFQSIVHNSKTTIWSCHSQLQNPWVIFFACRIRSSILTWYNTCPVIWSLSTFAAYCVLLYCILCFSNMKYYQVHPHPHPFCSFFLTLHMLFST